MSQGQLASCKHGAPFHSSIPLRLITGAGIYIIWVLINIWIIRKRCISMGIVGSKMCALGGWPRQEEPGAKDGRGTRAVGDDDDRLVIKVNKLLRRYDEGHLVIETTELEGAGMSRLPFCTGTLRICGEGGYGVVFESTLVESNAAVAVKMLSPDRFHEHFSLCVYACHCCCMGVCMV
jgi:hypothetical protein